MPGRSVEMKGAWAGSTPKSPSAPGTSTCSTSPEKTRRDGETSSNGKLAIGSNLELAAIDHETEARPDQPADQPDENDMLNLRRGEASAVAGDALAGHFDLHRSDLDLGR